MMNKKTILFIAIFQVILITGLYFALKSRNESSIGNKVVFIENIKVFENFQMKKEKSILGKTHWSIRNTPSNSFKSLASLTGTG